MEAAQSERAKRVDVVFYGDSITEGWRGTEYGRPNPKYGGAKEVFENRFISEFGAKYNGLALGISGDRVSLSNG